MSVNQSIRPITIEEKEHLFKILEISSDLKNIGEKFKNYSSMIKMNSLEEEEN